MAQTDPSSPLLAHSGMNRTFSLFKFVSAGFLATSLLCVGCSSGPPAPPTAKISGKITRKGKALPPLTVAFTAVSGEIAPELRYSATKTDGEGAFSIEKIPEAEYMVSLIEDAPTPEIGAGGKVQAVVGTPQLAKYSSNSPLRTTVKGPTSEFIYDIRE